MTQIKDAFKMKNNINIVFCCNTLMYMSRGEQDAHLRKEKNSSLMECEENSGKDGCKPVSADPERSSLALKARQGPPSEE